MKNLCALALAMFLSIAIGCGDSHTPDRTGVAPPKSPEDTVKENEAKMKQKGIDPSTYGKSQSAPETPPK